jgi:uncharacterized protein YbjT (DUF2867 family)
MVAGATGLVGRSLVEQLCGSAHCKNVVALTRRPLEFESDKLHVRQVDLARLDDEQAPRADVACCALGTTIATAGSQHAFRRVDHDYTLAFARFAERGGARRFLLVSSVSADAGSANFYLRVKGEVENAVRVLPFEALVILRPGLLLGDRRESRPAEAIARAVAPWLNPLLLGPLAKFRSIRADRVAAAMVAAATDERSGVTVLETPAIEALAEA